MKAYTAAQVRAAEQPLLDADVPLMQRAASALAEQIAALLPVNKPGRVLLLVGAGNNGGDALYAGAELARHGTAVSVVRTSERVHGAGLLAAVNAGAHVAHADDVDIVGFDILVDGILGTGAGIGQGQSAALRGRGREIVERMLPQLAAQQHPRVVAVDLPSGIHPDTGEVPEPVVLPADLTVTFGAAKAGLLRGPASDYVGRLVVADIGLGLELANFSPVSIGGPVDRHVSKGGDVPFEL